jgi:hypothetical protein
MPLKRAGILLGQQIALYGPSTPVFDLKKRPSRNFCKSAILCGTSPTETFSQVCSDTVGSFDQLHPDGILGKPVPIQDMSPSCISDILRHPVNSQTLEACPGHNASPRQSANHPLFENRLMNYGLWCVVCGVW